MARPSRCWWIRSRESRSDVEEANVLGVLLDEVPAGLDVLAHQRGEDLVGSRASSR